MSRRHAMIVGMLASVLTLAASIAQANVFNMPAGQTSLSFVPVGNPGNAPDTTVESDGTSGYGSVSYADRMGEYDVTVGQYVQFLNAVAKTDTYGLYSRHGRGGNADYYFPTIGIARIGTSGSFTYWYTGVYNQAVNCPIFDVTWGDAARFCNWLQNGHPMGAEGPGTTETGAYTLSGATSQSALMAITRNTGATCFMPSENEWYKAAYYNPSTGTYWTFPTQSNTAPSNVLSSTGTNNANTYSLLDGGYEYTDWTNYLTPVGAFSASPGPYGTYDMGGDVEQWNEAIGTNVAGDARGLRGGDWYWPSYLLASSNRGLFNPTSECSYSGFRVASVLEPGDANGDGKVDINDLTIVPTNFGQTGMTWGQGDFIGDGRVDINDLTIVLTSFGYAVTAACGLAAVPEPSALVLIGVGVVSLLACGRGGTGEAR